MYLLSGSRGILLDISILSWDRSKKINIWVLLEVGGIYILIYYFSGEVEAWLPEKTRRNIPPR